jgi:hypothetical protein
VLDTLSPEARAVLSDLSSTATRRGVIKNVPDQSPETRLALDELIEARAIRRIEGDLVLLLSSEERADLSPKSISVRLTSSSSKLEAGQTKGGTARMASPYSPTAGCGVKSTSKDITKRPGTAIQKIPVSLWRGSHLASYFALELRDHAVLARVALGPDPVAIGALSGSMSRWINKDGMTPEQIKAMIDLFCTDIARYVRKGTPAWKTFLARRTSLYQKAERVVEETTRKTAGTDYWTGTADATVHDDSYWIGAKA